MSADIRETKEGVLVPPWVVKALFPIVIAQAVLILTGAVRVMITDTRHETQQGGRIVALEERDDDLYARYNTMAQVIARLPVLEERISQMESGTERRLEELNNKMDRQDEKIDRLLER